MRAGLQRRLATGVNAVAVAALVVALVGLLVEVAARTRVRVDLSSDGAATLQPETEAILGRLASQDDVFEVTAFSAQKRNAEAWYRDRVVRDLLRELSFRSPRIRTRFVDFDADRLTAERLGVDRYGTMVIEGRGDRVDLIDREFFRHRGKGKDRELEFSGEAAITRGIEQILAEDARVLYTLYGHGELRVFDRGIGELTELGELTTNQGWTVRVLDLLRDRPSPDAPPTIPADAAAVLLLGPRHTLTGVEEEALREFMGSGGSLGFFLDTGGGVPALVEDLGVRVPEGVALDTVAVYPHDDRPLLRYQAHPITDALVEADTSTLVAHAAPLDVSARDGVTSSPLLTTSRRGWIERGTERPPAYTPGADVEGPVTVGVALTVQAPHPIMRRGSGRVLVLGDVDMISDELLSEGPGNATFVVNGLRWLVRADDHMSRVGRPSRIRKLAMTAEQLTVIRWWLILGLPLIAVMLGGAVWAGRRSR